MASEHETVGPISELHIELEPVQPAGERYWQLRYTDSLGHTGLSTRTFGSVASALRGAEAFFERVWEIFEAQEGNEDGK